MIESITLILAVDQCDHDDRDVHLFYARHHYKRGDHANLREAFQAAFEDWAGTPDGEKYVEANGSNWGDLALRTEYREEVGVGESSRTRAAAAVATWLR